MYDDHYAYGLTDRAVLEAYSDAAGGRLLERTPCFIWYEGCTPMTVDKTLQTVDLLPTLANLFGLPAPRTMGQDAFDPSYEGYAIFPDGTWLNDKAYVKNGEVVWNNGMTDEEIAEMTAYAPPFPTDRRRDSGYGLLQHTPITKGRFRPETSFSIGAPGGARF